MADHPTHVSDRKVALREGSVAGYSEGSSGREFYLMVHTRFGFTTLAACKFNDPSRNIARALRVFDDYKVGARHER